MTVSANEIVQRLFWGAVPIELIVLKVRRPASIDLRNPKRADCSDVFEVVHGGVFRG